MPQNQFQRMVFAFLTVLITVHAYVFYSLYVINGQTFLDQAALIGVQTNSVIEAINALGGVPMFGTRLPIWAVILIEFCCAYALENLLGSPLSFKCAMRVFDPRKNHPMLFESAIICATVGIMCPAMSFLASFFYYPYEYVTFNMVDLLARWLKLVCYNLPFAYFSQLLFIQPLVRVLFKAIFRRKIKEREAAQAAAASAGEKPITPTDETEAIADVWKRMDELQEELAHERRQRKKLQARLDENGK